MKSKGKGPKSSVKDAGRPARKRIFLVDDHPMMRDGMRMLIDSEPGLMCCGGAKSAEEALQQIPQCQPDLVILPKQYPIDVAFGFVKPLAARFEGIGLAQGRAVHAGFPLFAVPLFDREYSKHPAPCRRGKAEPAPAAVATAVFRRCILRA